MLKHVALVQMDEEWWYYEGFLLIDASLSAARILEVIGMFLDGDEAGK